ncbi:MAG: UDP-N-acetylglucosamine--LPS N-acetylglucosamine transferase [Candidatus Aminicenantes bacterium]|nr:UDP-N-acetylglucosamine--LPS N-acetylglucosamine transferase [Candidatus Aminicenantes bacterium]
MKIGLICSPGGHFYEMARLKSAWQGHDSFWVTIQSIDTDSLLAHERVYYAHAPTTRNLINLIKNLFLAAGIMRKENPDVIISTGGPICIPFFFFSRLFRIKCIYIESLTRCNNLSWTGKLVYPVASIFLVQWAELVERYKKAQYKGRLL